MDTGFRECCQGVLPRRGANEGDHFRNAAAVSSALGTTVKRVERLMRVAPELVPRIAAGELSVKQALKAAVRQGHLSSFGAQADSGVVLRRLTQAIRREWDDCPRAIKRRFLYELREQLRELIREYKESAADPSAA